MKLNALQPNFCEDRITDKIFCVMKDHDYFHEMQVITQIFFAHAKFVLADDISQEGYTVYGLKDKTSCTGELYFNGEKVASRTLKCIGEALPEKRVMMLALFYALKEVINKPTPWGALTGVRPAKQVRIWLDENDTIEQISDRLSRIYKLRSDKIDLAIKVAEAEKSLKIDPAIGLDKVGLDKIGLDKVGLYIGIPFCPSRCSYCSFVSSQKSNSKYLNALANELKKKKEKRKIDASLINTVYIGGGTPTALSEEDFKTLLEMVAPFVNRSEHTTEYTVEAGRPDSITQGKLKLMKDHGVTRIAINPQTLNDNTLKRIGRAHTAYDFYKAYEMAKTAGFDNINTDVIAGLPGETEEDMHHTMNGLKSLAPPHITVHTLAVKRASLLNEKRLNENRPAITALSASFQEIDNMLKVAQEACESLNLSPYYMYRQKNMVGHFENVGYSKPGHECIYNIAMMAETGSVIAVGAGAVSKKVTKNIQGDLITREFNPKDIETYIERMMDK